MDSPGKPFVGGGEDMPGQRGRPMCRGDGSVLMSFVVDSVSRVASSGGVSGAIACAL